MAVYSIKVRRCSRHAPARQACLSQAERCLQASLGIDPAGRKFNVFTARQLRIRIGRKFTSEYAPQCRICHQHGMHAARYRDEHICFESGAHQSIRSGIKYLHQKPDGFARVRFGLIGGLLDEQL